MNKKDFSLQHQLFPRLLTSHVTMLCIKVTHRKDASRIFLSFHLSFSKNITIKLQAYAYGLLDYCAWRKEVACSHKDSCMSIHITGPCLVEGNTGKISPPMKRQLDSNLIIACSSTPWLHGKEKRSFEEEQTLEHPNHLIITAWRTASVWSTNVSVT